MNEIQKKYGPFAHDGGLLNWPGRDHVVTCDAHDRIAMVKASTDPEWLTAVIRDRDVQSTVRLAAERRLRKLKSRREPQTQRLSYATPDQ